MRSTEASFAQQRVFEQHRRNGVWSIGGVYLCLRFNGRLDQAAGESSLALLWQRHASMRSRLRYWNDHVVQDLTEEPLPLVSRRVRSTAEAEKLLSSLSSERLEPDSFPLVKLHMVSVSDEDVSYLLLLSSHVIFDGWSLDIFLKEFAIAYKALCRSEVPILPPVRQFHEWSALQRDAMRGSRGVALSSYWSSLLKGAKPVSVTQLPDALIGPEEKTNQFASVVTAELGEGLCQELSKLMVRERVTPFIFHLAVFQIVTCSAIGQDATCLLATFANRDPESLSTIGWLSHVIAFPARLHPNEDFVRYLGRARRACISIYDHAEMPWALLLKTLQPEMYYESVFPPTVYFACSSPDSNPVNLDGLGVDVLNLAGYPTCGPGIGFFLSVGAKTSLKAIYEAARYPRPVVDNFVTRWHEALTRIAANPHIPVSRIT